MKLESSWVNTQKLIITESHLLIPMIWEGDLQLHSNEEYMKQTSFQTVILHGDTCLTLAISLIEQYLNKTLTYKKVTSKYKSSLCLHDEVFVAFQHQQHQIEFSLINQHSVVLLEGQLSGIEAIK